MYEADKPVARLLDEVIALRQQVDSLQSFVLERSAVEAELRKAKEAAETADRTKAEFVATLSHELRSPISVMLGYVELLLAGGFGEIPAQQQDVLDKIQQNIHQLLELISGLLDLSRLEVGRTPLELGEVGIADLLQTIEQEMPSLPIQSQLNFVWRVADNLPLVCTDSTKLKVVIKNLIGNAMKFTEKGSITVESRQHAGGVKICVADTGIGIPKESLPVIFEPFQQLQATDGQGTGLGLHIVKRFLALLGGSITVESEVGRGSTFCVWVPAANPPRLSPSISLPAEPVRHASQNGEKNSARRPETDSTLL